MHFCWFLVGQDSKENFIFSENKPIFRTFLAKYIAWLVFTLVLHSANIKQEVASSIWVLIRRRLESSYIILRLVGILSHRLLFWWSGAKSISDKTHTFEKTWTKGLSKKLLFQNLICNFIVNRWSQQAVFLRTWSTN